MVKFWVDDNDDDAAFSEYKPAAAQYNSPTVSSGGFEGSNGGSGGKYVKNSTVNNNNNVNSGNGMAGEMWVNEVEEEDPLLRLESNRINSISLPTLSTDHTSISHDQLNFNSNTNTE